MIESKRPDPTPKIATFYFSRQPEGEVPWWGTVYPFRWYRTWRKTYRVAARLLRLKRKLRMKAQSAEPPTQVKNDWTASELYTKLKPFDGNIEGPTQEEAQEARNTIIRHVQAEEFPTEVEALLKNETIPPNSHIKDFAPELDAQGILRIGTRLRKLYQQQDIGTPIILPKNHILTDLIIQDTHCEQTEARRRGKPHFGQATRRLLANPGKDSSTANHL